MPTLNLGRVRLNARGVYDNSASYDPLDVVSINGSSYFCRLSVQGVQPGTAGADLYWQFLVGEFDLADTVLNTGSGTDSLIDTLDKRIIYVDTVADMQALAGYQLKDSQQIHVKNVGMFSYENESFVPQSVNVQTGESFPSPAVKDQLFILEPDGLYYYNDTEWVPLINLDLLQSKVDEAEAFADAAESQADRAAQEVNDGIVSGVASGVDQVSTLVSAEADRAEAAANTAFTNADVYESTAAGLAATTTGEQFTVVTGDVSTRYLNNAGVAEELATYPTGSEDVTKAHTSAISSDVLDRVADNPLAYTSSLASGDVSERAPIPYEGTFEFLKSNAVTGAAYSIQSPNTLALRKLINVHSTRAFEIKVLTGVSSDELDADFVVGIAWYDKDKNRLAETPSTEFYRGSLSNDSQRFVFTVQNDVGDISFPDGATYMLPYISTNSTTGRFWGSELTITDTTTNTAVKSEIGVAQKGYVGDSPDNYTFDVSTPFPRPATQLQARTGSLGARLSILADSVRESLGTANLLPLSKSGQLRYDVHYSAAIGSLNPGGPVEPADGDLEIAMAWFDQERNYLSESVGYSFPITGTLQAMAVNVVRASKFNKPLGAVYARPFLRITGTVGVIAVLRFFAQSHEDSEHSGPSIASLPARVLARAVKANAYDPVDSNSVHVDGDIVQSVNDSISSRPLEALGQSFSKPRAAVVKGYKCLTSIGVDEDVRITVDGGVTYGNPGLLVFAAYASSEVSTLRSLIHGGLGEYDSAPGTRLRINANAIRDNNGDWLSRTGRVGIAIDGVTDGQSGAGDPLAASAPQDTWNVFSLVLKEAPAKSEWWCNGSLVDTFTMPSGLTLSRRTDLFKGSSFDAGHVAIGRICFSDIDATDDDRIQLERWAAEPIGKPLVTNRTVSKPVIDATSVCAMRVKDGAVLFDQDAYARQNIASLTKIFTALIADKWVLDFDEELAAPIDVDGAGLQVGDVMSMKDAISLMLIPSNNACSTATGRRVGQIIQEIEGVQNGESADFRGYREMEFIGRNLLGMVRPQFDGFIAGTLSGTQICALDVCRALCHINSSKRLMGIMSQSRHTATIVDGPDPRTIDYVTSIQFLSFHANRLHTVLAGKTGTTSTTGQSLGILVEMPEGDIVAFVLTGSPPDPGRYDQMQLVMEYVEKTYYA